MENKDQNIKSISSERDNHEKNEAGTNKSEIMYTKHNLFGGNEEIIEQFDFENPKAKDYPYSVLYEMVSRFEGNLYAMGLLTNKYPIVKDLYELFSTPSSEMEKEFVSSRLQFVMVILITDPHTLLAAHIINLKEGLSKEIIISQTCRNCGRIIVECPYHMMNPEKALRKDLNERKCQFCSKVSIFKV